MWENFTLQWDDRKWTCEAEVSHRPSMFGIREGRVSKFYVYGDKGRLYAYERGWLEKEAPRGLIDKLMERYPETSAPSGVQ